MKTIYGILLSIAISYLISFFLSPFSLNLLIWQIEIKGLFLGLTALGVIITLTYNGHFGH